MNKLKVTFHNGLEEETFIEVFKEDQPCEHCDTIGSYVLEEADGSQGAPFVGLCEEGLKNDVYDVEEIN